MPIEDGILQVTLLTWGMCHRNREYYTNEADFWNWYESAFAELQQLPDLADARQVSLCYTIIHPYLLER